LLSEALTTLKGVGPALAKKLEKLGLSRVEDLLFLLPLRYEDRTQLVKIGALVAGKRCAETAFRGRRNLLVRLSDGSGQLTLRFFHFSRQQQAQFQAGVHVTCFGEVRRGPAGFEMIHPEYRILRDQQATAIPHPARPTGRGNERLVDAYLSGHGGCSTRSPAQPDRPGATSDARRAATRAAAAVRHRQTRHAIACRCDSLSSQAAA
jgi:RecG-like helicase